MIIHALTKPLLIFLAGVIFAFLVVQAFAKPNIFEILGNRNPRSGSVEEQVKEEIHKKETRAAKSATRTLLEKVLPAIAENPVIAPVVETKKEVEQTVQTLRSLPEAQKNAVCKQVCGE